MKPHLIPIIALCLAALPSSAADETTPDRPVIYVSILPQAWMLERLGALDECDVFVLLPAASGHVNYSPNPSQIRNLARARVYVRSGLPFEDRIWDRIRGLNPDMTVIDVPKPGRAELDPHGHEHGHGHEHDPHFWLDPLLMLQQAEETAAVLPDVLGLDAETVQKHVERLRVEVGRLDAEIRALLNQSGRKSFWTFHASWGHFAEHYGLEQHAIEFEGKESGLRTMISIVSELESSGADFILVEPGLDQDRLSVLRNEAGLRFVEVNPMRRDYVQSLLDAAAAIAGGGR